MVVIYVNVWYNEVNCFDIGGVQMNLFYVPIPNPISYSNYQNSVLSCVTYTNKNLNEIFNTSNHLGLWGFKNGSYNEEMYNQINVGDIIFFRINDEKYQAFDGFGYVAKKVMDGSIAKQVWGDSDYKNLIIIDKYFRFYTPFHLSANKVNIASIDGVAEDVWHRQYNMFRRWAMTEDNAKLIVDFLSNKNLSLDLYDSNEYYDQFTEIGGDDSINENIIPETERNATRVERKGQDRFRADLLLYNNKCEICGISDKRLLVASHIKPWKYSRNIERLDRNNGLLLCAMHDKLFDKGIISFSDDGIIQISPTLSKSNRNILKISPKTKIELNNRKKQYMRWHRENLYEGDKI